MTFAKYAEKRIRELKAEREELQKHIEAQVPAIREIAKSGTPEARNLALRWLAMV